MHWTEKYTNRKDFLILFDNEQDYVDFMFTQIIMLNFGIYCKPKQRKIGEHVEGEATEA